MTPLGWCPSTYRIYEAPDGGLARVRVPGGIVRLDQLRIVADAAGALGNGVVDLTSRANLQIRGIDPSRAGQLRERLAPVGLTAPSAAIEDRRNVLASPTAGLAVDEVLDVRSTVASIVDALDALPAAIEPPDKFGVLIDGGGEPSLREIVLDVALGASVDPQQAVVLEVGLGTALDDVDPTDSVTIVPEDAGTLVAAAAVLCAAPPAGAVPGRMATIVSSIGRTAVFAELGRSVTLHAAPAISRQIRPVSFALLGHHPALGQRRSWVGVRVSADVVTAEHIGALADAVEDIGATEVRLTPWRSVIVAHDRDAELVDRRLLDAGWTTQAISAADGGAERRVGVA